MRINLSEEAARLEEHRFQEIRRFVKGIFETWLQDSELPSINRLAEAMTSYGLKSDELTTAIAQYQAQQRAITATNAARSRVVALFGVAVLCCLAALLWWRIGQLQGAEIAQTVTVAQLQERQQQFQRLQANIQAKQEALTKIEARIDNTQERLTGMARTMQALAGAQQAAQEQAVNLQRLNQQFQFRLLQMDSQQGPQVVIRVPPDAEPITVDGQQYIVVSQP